MLTVWGRATSSNVQKVMWTVGELGLEHRRIDCGGHFGGLDKPEYRALNPNGLVPTVEFGDGLVMFESNAIVRQLARTDPWRRLWPAGGHAEPLADMWAEWAQLNVCRHLTALFWAVVRTAPSKRNPAQIAGHFAAALDGFAIAETQLGKHAYVAGDALTIADIVFAHTLYRYYTMEVERPPMPNIDRYYKAMTERPAYAEHVMIDYETLRVHD